MDEPRDLPPRRHTIFQNSLMTALLDGIFDGEMTVGELLSHGDFGIGTFDALDGEMLVLDGVCYQLRADGSATVADHSQRSPFTVMTHFVPLIAATPPAGLRRAELSRVIDSMQPSENYMYALRITGTFSDVTVRTVRKQSRPYPPMVEATDDDAELHFRNVRGVVGGFRTPLYEKGIGVPGCHAHFVDADRTGGGHVLDFTLEEGQIELCPGTDLELRLPLTKDFSDAALAPEDLDAQIHSTEVKTPPRGPTAHPGFSGAERNSSVDSSGTATPGANTTTHHDTRGSLR